MRNILDMKFQRGQALILIGMSLIGLIAFVGLTIDAGILFAHIGTLRRAVDAAGLAAAGQYLQDTTASELEATVMEFLELNGIDSSQTTLEVNVCNLPGDPDFTIYHDSSLCKENNPWDYDRKLVFVRAEMPVNFVFLPVVGFMSTDIKAESIAEAASIDLVLVIDTSQSMADEGPPIPDCNADDSCLPFKDVRASAYRFVEEMSFPYDYVSIVTFDADGILHQTLTNNKAQALSVIDNLVVYQQAPCITLPDPGGCLSTNIAGGLREAGLSLSSEDFGGRDSSLWVLILLSDGSANQALDDDLAWICPNETGEGGLPTWIQPYCVDGDSDTRHAYGEVWYDTNDAAMDMADILGCYQDDNPDQSTYCDNFFNNWHIPNYDGFEALIFTIGMGDKMINGDCNAWYADNGETCHLDMGERLLRYIAAVGDDGNPASDLCAGAAQQDNCGNYYFAQTAADLDPVFRDIAKRIYTRITH